MTAVLTSCSSTPQFCTSPVISAPAVAAAASSPALGTKTDWSRLGVMKQYLQSLGGGVTFYEVAWCDVEKQPGLLDWSNPDTVINQAQSVGFTTMIKIRVGQCNWITGKPPKYLRGKQQKTESSMPKDLHAYTTFVKQVVQRYSGQGVKEYAVENEVNSASFWDGTPEEYSRLVTVAARAIHNVDPQVKVVDGGISSTASGYGVAERLLQLGRTQTAIDSYNQYFSRRIGTRGEQIVSVDNEVQLRHALDSEQGKRNLEFLKATNHLVAAHVVDVRQVHFYEDWSALPALLDYLDAVTPAGTPLEMWELGSFLGTSQLSEAQRNADLVKAIAIALSVGVSKVIWLPLNVDPASGDDRLYGLLSARGTMQAASVAFAALSHAARGGTPVAIKDSGIVGLAFDKGSHSTAFIWSDCAPVPVSLPSGSRIGTPGTTGTTRREHTVVGTDPVQMELPMPAERFLRTLP